MLMMEDDADVSYNNGKYTYNDHYPVFHYITFPWQSLK